MSFGIAHPERRGPPLVDHPRVRRALEGNAKRLRANPQFAPRPKKAIGRELLHQTYARGTLRAPRDRTLLLVLFATGMRRGEAGARDPRPQRR